MFSIFFFEQHEVLYGDLYNESDLTTPTTITTTSTTTTVIPKRSSLPQRSSSLNQNNNLSINRSIVESSRLGAVNNRGRRPPQRRPVLDNIKPNIDRFEHSRPIVPISNSINTNSVRSAVRSDSNNQLNRLTVSNPIAASILANNNIHQPNSINSIVPMSNSITAAPNNSPINSLISNPISSSIPINHLARANSFIPINNNLVNANSINANPLNNLMANSLSNSVLNPNSNSNSITNPISNSIGTDHNLNSNPKSNPNSNPNSITNPITKPIVRDRQNSGILEFNTKPERSHAVRPRPERIHEHSVNNNNLGRGVSRTSSRSTRVTTEASIEPNSIEELNLPNGGSGFGQRIRG